MQLALLQYKVLTVKMMVGLQIINCNGCYCVTANKEDKDTNIVKVCDSSYTSLDQLDASSIVQNIFCLSDVRPLRIQLVNSMC